MAAAARFVFWWLAGRRAAFSPPSHPGGAPPMQWPDGSAMQWPDGSAMQWPDA